MRAIALPNIRRASATAGTRRLPPYPSATRSSALPGRKPRPSQIPKTPFAQAEAIAWFGRAIGATRSGDLTKAKEAIDQLRVLKDRLAKANDAYWTGQVVIQERAAAGWLALAEGRKGDAIAALRQAADLEDRSGKHVAMENRLSPIREMFGELLLEASEPAQALKEFEASLRNNPNRYRSFAGAAKAAERAGDRAQARSYYEKLIALAAQSDGGRPDVLRSEAVSRGELTGCVRQWL